MGPNRHSWLSVVLGGVFICAGLLFGSAGFSPVQAQTATGASTPEPAQQTTGASTKLALPRFVSLRNSEVNMRAGPGVRYPVDWVYVRRELPVEIIAEFDIWRKIRDPDGTEGWVHQSMLMGRRMMMVKKDRVMLRRTADDTASAAAWLEAGVIGTLKQCPRDSAFCRVEVQGYLGWLRRDEMWGVYRSDVIDE